MCARLVRTGRVAVICAISDSYELDDVRTPLRRGFSNALKLILAFLGAEHARASCAGLRRVEV
jgi:hypothetical protein